MGLVDSGQYVFVNVDNTASLEGYRPWEDTAATEEENLEALHAFQALVVLNLGTPALQDRAN